MRFRSRKFMKWLLVINCAAFLMLSALAVHTSGKENQLDRAQKSIERAEKMAKDESVKGKLREVRKNIAEARKEFKKKNQKKAYKKTKGAASILKDFIAQPRDKNEMLTGQLNRTLENLYEAIRQLGGYKVTTETGWGLCTSTLETIQGMIRFNLPSEMFADDKILGTVTVKPAGKTEEEREADLNALREYAIEIMEIKDMQLKAGQSKVTLLIPKSLKVINLIFKDEFGIEAGKTKIPVHPNPSVFFPRKRLIEPNPPKSTEENGEKFNPTQPQKIEPVSPADFQLPNIGELGIPLQIFGPFDADFNNTRILINGNEAEILTEFPRGLIAQNPLDTAGPAEIVLEEGEVVVRNKVNFIALFLSAPKLSLRRGEQTTLTVTVEGLEGYEEDLPLYLNNLSPGIIRLEGGNSQYFLIHPEEHELGGTYSLNRRLTGVRPGDFEIIAAVPIDLINSAMKLGSYTGERYRIELTAEEMEILFNAPISDYIEFMKNDLNTYATKDEFLDISELKELLSGIENYLSQTKPEDQAWIADIYVGTVLKVLRKGIPTSPEEAIKIYIWENIDLLQKPTLKKK